jgi:multiple sugar transport system permease protein
MQAFRKIIFPLAAPGLATCTILVFIFAWNEFMFAQTFMQSENMYTITIGLTMFEGQYTIPWGEISAAAVVVTIPLIILVLLFQKRIVQGLTGGAVKG